MKYNLHNLRNLIGVLSLLFLCSSISSQSYTLYTIIGDHLAEVDPNTGDATNIGALSPGYSDFAGLCYEPNLDKLLVITDRSTNPKLVEVDRCTGQITEIGLIDQQTPFLDFKLIEAMDYNSDDGKLYAAGYERSVSQNWFFSRRLMKIDPTTGNATVVNTITGTCQSEADAFAFSSTTKFSLDGCPFPRRLYSINLSTGQSTFIGSNNITSGAILATDPVSGELYSVNIPNRQLFNISTINGAATLIGTTHTTNEFGGGLVSQLAFALDVDSDCDGINNSIDNCIDVANFDQSDIDLDNLGDACDTQFDSDVLVNVLIDSINAIGVSGANGMISKLNNALDFCDSGNTSAAIAQLNSFINQVNGKRGNQLTNEEADFFVGAANDMIDAINNGTASCGSSQIIGSIKKEVNASLEIYPNPAIDNITLGGDMLNALSVSIYSMNGSLIRTVKGQNEIDISDLESGLYILNAVTAKGIKVGKFVKH